MSSKNKSRIIKHPNGSVNIAATERANGLGRRTLRDRLDGGMPLEEAVSRPIRGSQPPIWCEPGTRRERPEYGAWKAAKQRTTNPNAQAWRNYGNRGIRICQRWRNSFKDFLEDMGPKPSLDLSLERRNNEGHYSCGKCEECKANGWPANCYWATLQKQVENMRTNVWVDTPWGKLTRAEACRKTGINPGELWRRMKARGLTYEEALFHWKPLR